MEDLTKQQIVLLTLLVSFVTSIATGIITVSLMEQAPPAITQTVNRVVEKTIEKVVPENNTASVVQKETIVVKADDMVVSAVEKNLGSIVKIKEVYVQNGERKENIGGLAVVLNKNGLLATDASILVKNLGDYGPEESYFAIFNKEKVLPIFLKRIDKTNGIAFFEANKEDVGTANITYNPVTVGMSSALKLGQAVIAIGGVEDTNITTGIISGFAERNSEKIDSQNTVPKVISLIRTDIFSPDVMGGSILMNLSGEVIGIKAGVAMYAKNNFLPLDGISIEEKVNNN